MKSYRDATCWACDQVEDHVVDGKLNFPKVTFADVVVHVCAGLQFFRPEDARTYFTVTEHLARELVLLALEDYQFFDLCQNINATNLLADAELPESLRIFAARVAEGRIARPSPSHRPRNRNWFEQFFLWVIVKQIAKQFDLDETRNDATRTACSACDAMAEALTFCGRKTSYSEIKNLMVHTDKKRLRDEFWAYIGIARRRNIRGLDPEASAEARAWEAVTDILRTFPKRKEKSPELS